MSNYYPLEDKTVEREKQQVYYRKTEELAVPRDYFENIKREMRMRYVDLATCISFKAKMVAQLQDLRRKIDIIDSRIRAVEKPSVETIEIKEMTLEEAKPLVENFLRDHLSEHDDVYPSDVADELGLKYELVREIFSLLEEQEKLRKKEE